MFEQTFVDGTGKTNKSWTILLSFGIQMLLIAVGVIIPLIYFDALPKAQLTTFFDGPAAATAATAAAAGGSR